MSPFLELMDIFAIISKILPKSCFFFFSHEKVLLNQECILQLEEIHFSRWGVGRNREVLLFLVLPFHSQMKTSSKDLAVSH